MLGLKVRQCTSGGLAEGMKTPISADGCSIQCSALLSSFLPILWGSVGSLCSSEQGHSWLASTPVAAHLDEMGCAPLVTEARCLICTLYYLLFLGPTWEQSQLGTPGEWSSSCKQMVTHSTLTSVFSDSCKKCFSLSNVFVSRVIPKGGSGCLSLPSCCWVVPCFAQGHDVWTR